MANEGQRKWNEFRYGGKSTYRKMKEVEAAWRNFGKPVPNEERHTREERSSREAKE